MIKRKGTKINIRTDKMVHGVRVIAAKPGDLVIPGIHMMKAEN